MKKLLSITLVALLLVSMFLMTGCSSKPSTLKFGTGVYVGTPTTTDATADKEGTGKIDITVAAVTVDANGKIVACQLDTMSNSIVFDKDGKASITPSFKTKYEAGANYGMVNYGGAKKEWFEQVDAFEAVVAGKTLDEVKALVADGNKGNSDVVNAGCTIMINEFVGAIEKAYKAATNSTITADDTLKVSAYTEQVCSHATAEKDGSNKVSTTVFAAALNAEGKIITAFSDCVEVNFTFNNKGASTLDTTKAVLSKKEQGANYGMVAYGGAKKEWFEQAAAFDAACVGKTVDEVVALATDKGTGVEELQTAGCTIAVTGFVKAAEKIG